MRHDAMVMESVLFILVMCIVVSVTLDGKESTAISSKKRKLL